MKAQLRRALISASNSAAARKVVRGVARWERRRDEADGRLAVLTYHRIGVAGQHPELIESLRSTDPAGFEAQIALLAEHHRFLSIEELLELRRTGSPPPARAAVITFDDAYADLAEHGWPVLARLGIPAVAFVPTGFVGTGRAFWWDAVHNALTATSHTELPWGDSSLPLGSPVERKQAIRVVRTEVKAMDHHRALDAVDALVEVSGVAIDPAPVLDWDRLRALHAEGLVLAPHTRTHAFLDRVSAQEARAEIEGSMADLRDQIGTCPPVFAYPSGQWNADARQAAIDAGIEIAMTTTRGVNRIPGADWLTLDRVNVGAATTPAVLQAQLLRTTGRAVTAVSP